VAEPSRIAQRLIELHSLAPDDSSQAFKTWRRKARIDLCHAFGDQDYHVSEFDRIHFTSRVGFSMSDAERRQGDFNAFEAGRKDAVGLLEGALYRVVTTTVSVDMSTAGSIDPELAEHVANLLRDEDWVKLPTQTVVFVEDTVRRWAELPADVTGKDLWVKVLHHKSGRYPLGETPGEREGWFQLGMGFSLAVRNASSHRIAERQDAKRYALGIVGTASLLLTQLKHDHGSEIAEAQATIRRHPMTEDTAQH